MTTFRFLRPSAASAFALALVAAASAQRPTNVPSLSSRPGAAYTMYLDFAGFDFTGDWGGDAASPTVKTYAPFRSAAAGFTAAQQSDIATIYARLAEKYSAFGINVTTVDPAAAGLSDKQRQAYYDSQAGVMHSVISPTDSPGDNYSSGGVSYVGVTPNAQTTTQNGGASRGYHTNFVSTPAAPTYENAFNLKSTAEVIAHEDGHGLGLNHQSDYSGTTEVREYSSNFNDSNQGFSVGSATNKSFAPIMGTSMYDQRGLWRSGTIQQGSTGTTVAMQNDVTKIYSDARMGGPVEDGIGNSFLTATSLVTNGGTVVSSLMKGIVVPTSATSGPLGASSYQGGYYKFFSDGLSAVSLRATNGSSFLQAGVADPGMTLENSLSIFDGDFNLIGTGTEDSLTRWTQFDRLLGAGTYYAFITSTGGFVSATDSRNGYYNMGSYFLSGSGFAAAPVPEPATLAALGVGALAVLRRRRRV